ncbi:uncharacterized protein LOC123705961 [Colias croceus]|uniref:uncharacterized protein LOC123705961 n=1 Tax=Colias crocea TaxID=72248 RepID=UPI001E28196A|nr:uncharacterized protein LOC123705961 [Colias croceus]
MGSCRQCQQKHNTLLHSSNDDVTANLSTDEQVEPNESVAAFSRQMSKHVLLSTALIEVFNPINKQVEKVRALLDCGSQSSFITKSLQRRMSLRTCPMQALNVIGIGNNSSNTVYESCLTQIKSLNSNYSVTLSCLVLNELTGRLPKTPVDIQALKIPNSLTLADPEFYKPAPIEVLIGADIFWDILNSEQLSLGPNNPKLQNSKFGWIIAGPINNYFSKETIHCNHSRIANPTSNEIHKMLTKFWELEELPQKTVRSQNDIACEKYFLNTTTRLESGRFCVKLPLKDSPDCLGDSYSQAKKRFLNLEQRFRRNKELESKYVEFIREYADMGHLSESPTLIPNPSYFLCHHAVIKENSESTKLRVVFDGSAPTTSGSSVNGILMVGPNIQDSLFSILVRARQHKFILTGDIAKMYRQVQIESSDQNLQLILWREDESQPIKTLRLSTVTYGTASASYLSTRCLWQVGQECGDEIIKNIIQHDFYVDDLITGCDDEDQLKYIQNSVSNALNSACFPLRKYKTNSKNLFQNLHEINTEHLTISESSSTLGLCWDPSKDAFSFPIEIPLLSDKITKRLILSSSFRIFDPLGLLSPCIIQPKILH